jgi:hypothetical protein
MKRRKNIKIQQQYTFPDVVPSSPPPPHLGMKHFIWFFCFLRKSQRGKKKKAKKFLRKNLARTSKLFLFPRENGDPPRPMGNRRGATAVPCAPRACAGHDHLRRHRRGRRGDRHARGVLPLAGAPPPQRQARHAAQGRDHEVGLVACLLFLLTSGFVLCFLFCTRWQWVLRCFFCGGLRRREFGLFLLLLVGLGFGLFFFLGFFGFFVFLLLCPWC